MEYSLTETIKFEITLEKDELNQIFKDAVKKMHGNRLAAEGLDVDASDIAVTTLLRDSSGVVSRVKINMVTTRGPRPTEELPPLQDKTKHKRGRV